ncbi:ABC transporter ATP-binding protein [Actibacterium lipolyticum]|uniref:Lipid A export ATP-binding/permease protein MsbA n=1 Tax=Actibacterium lipolyticum TaxID=1524263 RepID=A0A238KNE5_9RHOB|nr:ABC transporter ATP-binding protein [Actibacterium lipolyticum]SMX43546.1 Lipid A export ATP-binding/permease protein MsbA [Actibacterium lipolyticum]
MADAPASSRTIVKWMWRGYLKRQMPMLLAALVLMTLEGSMLGFLSYAVKPMFDQVFTAGDRSALMLVAGGIFVVFLIRALSGFGQRIMTTLVGQRVSAALQADMVAHMLTLDSQWFQKTPPGGLIERVRGDTQAASNIWFTVLATAGRDIVALISLLAVALSVDWVWTLIAVAGVPLLFVPVASLQRWVRVSTRKGRRAAAAVSTRLDEVFHGVTTIKLNRMESREKSRFTEAVEAVIHAQLRSRIGQAGIPALIDVVAGLGFFGVIFYGGLQIIEAEKTVGEFMSFFTAMALIFDPLRRIGGISGSWQAAMASLERVYEIFDDQPTITSPARPAKLSVPAGEADVTMRDVHLAYQDTPVLNGLTLTAKAGKMTALVGASGAGKSTVFNLLTRLIEPQSGSVELGSVPIDQLELQSLRGNFSVVTQDAMLFDETLRDNILLGRADVTEERLQEVLEAAHIADFLPSLPNGLDSPAGARGSNLSGGQRQRVAIARALLRDAPILLLDEATSALDAKSERVVQDALERLSANRTTIVIAHRLATVRDADNIIVMDKGRVIEEGTHDALLEKGGLYSGLYKLQFATEN